MDPPPQAPACGMHHPDAGAAGRGQPALGHRPCPVSLPAHHPSAAVAAAGRHDPPCAMAAGIRADSLPVLPAAALGRAAGHCAVPGGRHPTAGRHRADRHPADPAGSDPLDRTVGAGAVPLPAFAAAAIRHDPAAELSPASTPICFPAATRRRWSSCPLCAVWPI